MDYIVLLFKSIFDCQFPWNYWGLLRSRLICQLDTLPCIQLNSWLWKHPNTNCLRMLWCVFWSCSSEATSFVANSHHLIQDHKLLWAPSDVDETNREPSRKILLCRFTCRPIRMLFLPIPVYTMYSSSPLTFPAQFIQFDVFFTGRVILKYMPRVVACRKKMR